MKNKTKKILAGACLGVMGMGLMTGCSMTEEQQKALNDIVGKSDQIVELLDKQSKNLSAEEALRLYEFSKTRLIVNKDNVWDNMKMIIHQDDNDEEYGDVTDGEYHFYKFADEKKVFYYKVTSGTDQNEIDGWFDDFVEKEPTPPGSVSSISSYTWYAGYMATAMIGVIDITAQDIVDCKVLDNGNYQITASVLLSESGTDPEGLPCLIDVELTTDGYLVYYNAKSLCSVNGFRYQYLNSTTVKYEYGTLTEAEVQANIDAYIAQEAENN